MESFISDLEKAKLGDPVAVASLVSRFEPVVACECSRFGALNGAELSRADLVQEVWLRIWTRIGQFRGSSDEVVSQQMFTKWLRVTAKNVIVNVLKKAGARHRYPEHPVLNLGDNFSQPAPDPAA